MAKEDAEAFERISAFVKDYNLDPVRIKIDLKDPFWPGTTVGHAGLGHAVIYARTGRLLFGRWKKLYEHSWMRS